VRRFEAALWALFAAPRLQHELASGDTVICRCEEVSRGRLEAALADGAPSIGELKQRTRVGMGLCQGRYCAPVLAALLAERHDRPLDEHAYFAPRLPARPVSIGDLARLAAKREPA
jgi:NAD(P)H-nitrite reductase large subunit